VAPITTPVLDVMRPESANAVGGEIESSTLALIDTFHAGPITTLDQMQDAVVDRQTIGAAITRIEDFFAPLKQMAHKLHRALCDRESAILAPLRAFDGARRDAMQEFRRLEEAERRARESRLADEAKQLREQTAAAEAAALEHQGFHDEAAAVVQEAIAAPAPVVVERDPVKAIVGFKTRREYKWRYSQNDPVRAARLIPREYLVVDEKKIGAYARSMKGTGTIPGIEFYSDDVPVR